MYSFIYCLERKCILSVQYLKDIKRYRVKSKPPFVPCSQIPSSPCRRQPLIPVACVSFQNVHFITHFYQRPNVGSLPGWQASLVVFGMRKVHPLSTALSHRVKSRQNPSSMFTPLSWGLLACIPAVLLTLTCPFLPRENHQLPTASSLLPPSGSCLLFPQGLSWQRNSSLLSNSWYLWIDEPPFSQNIFTF